MEWIRPPRKRSCFYKWFCPKRNSNPKIGSQFHSKMSNRRLQPHRETVSEKRSFTTVGSSDHWKLREMDKYSIHLEKNNERIQNVVSKKTTQIHFLIAKTDLLESWFKAIFPRFEPKCYWRFFSGTQFLLRQNVILHRFWEAFFKEKKTVSGNDLNL